MVVTPNSNIRLVKVPLTINNKNQLTFESKEAQFEYFNSLPFIEMKDTSYHRKDGTIRYDGLFDDLIGYNYCMYQNESYSNKWFYAFITKMTYQNNSLTYIEIATDVWQTWQFDIQFKESFIEREMIDVSSDVSRK